MPAPAYWQVIVYYGPGRYFKRMSQPFTGVDAEDNARTWLEAALEENWVSIQPSGAEIVVPKANVNYAHLQFNEATT